MTLLQQKRFIEVKSRLGVRNCNFLTQHYESVIKEAIDKDILASYVKLNAWKSGLSREFLAIRDRIYDGKPPAYDWNLSLMYLWITYELGYSCKVIPPDNSKYHGAVIVDLVKKL